MQIIMNGERNDQHCCTYITPIVVKGTGDSLAKDVSDYQAKDHS
jgi:hypothetical protein